LGRPKQVRTLYFIGVSVISRQIEILQMISMVCAYSRFWAAPKTDADAAMSNITNSQLFKNVVAALIVLATIAVATAIVMLVWR
jgi:hypothetical protein